MSASQQLGKASLGAGAGGPSLPLAESNVASIGLGYDCWAISKTAVATRDVGPSQAVRQHVSRFASPPPTPPAHSSRDSARASPPSLSPFILPFFPFAVCFLAKPPPRSAAPFSREVSSMREEERRRRSSEEEERACGSGRCCRHCCRGRRGADCADRSARRARDTPTVPPCRTGERAPSSLQ